MGAFDAGTRQFSWPSGGGYNPTSGNGYDSLFGNIISAFNSAQEALVGPNKFLDLVMTDIDPSNSAYQGKTIEINFPESDGEVVNMSSAYGTDVTLNPVKTIRRFLTLDQHPTYAFVIPDMDKALAARPEELRKMFVDEAIKKFTTYVNRTLFKLVYNTGGSTIFGTSAGNSLIKLNGESPEGGMSEAEWLGFKNKGIDPIDTTSTTAHNLPIPTLAKMWQALTEAKCPTDDTANLHLLVRPSTFTEIITDNVWTSQSQVGEGIAAGVRTSARINTTFGVNVDWDLDVPIEVDDDDESPTYEKMRYHNILFHKRAFAVAYRPLELPPPSVGVQSSMAYYRGIPIRFMVSYDPKQFTYILTFDSLFGAMVFRPEFAVRSRTPFLATA
jgi:hypothetical protein